MPKTPIPDSRVQGLQALCRTLAGAEDTVRRLHKTMKPTRHLKGSSVADYIQRYQTKLLAMLCLVEEHASMKAYASFYDLSKMASLYADVWIHLCMISEKLCSKKRLGTKLVDSRTVRLLNKYDKLYPTHLPPQGWVGKVKQISSEAIFKAGRTSSGYSFNFDAAIDLTLLLAVMPVEGFLAPLHEALSKQIADLVNTSRTRTENEQKIRAILFAKRNVPAVPEVLHLKRTKHAAMTSIRCKPL